MPLHAVAAAVAVVHGVTLFLNATLLLSINGTYPKFNRSTLVNCHSTAMDRWEANQSHVMGEELDVSFGRTFVASSLGASVTPNAEGTGVNVTALGSKCGPGNPANQYNSSVTPYFSKPGQLSYIYSANTDFWYEKINPRGWSALGNATRAADYYATFIDTCIPKTGPGFPIIAEVMNEPLVHLMTVNASFESCLDIHDAVADKIHSQYSTEQVKVAGPVMVSLDFQMRGKGEEYAKDFGHFKEFFGRFIETSGSKMDLYSLHLYDGYSATSPGEWKQRRVGCNVQAILDLIEAYDVIVHGQGKKKQYVVSEFGTGIQDWKVVQPDRDINRDWAIFVGINGKLMEFMNRLDSVVKANPFVVHFGSFWKPSPYPFGLLDKIKVPGVDRYFVWSEFLKIYKFWRLAWGRRVVSETNDGNIQSAFFLQEKEDGGGHDYVLILNNIRDGVVQVNIDDAATQLKGLKSKAHRVRLYKNETGDEIVLRDEPWWDSELGESNTRKIFLQPNEITSLTFSSSNEAQEYSAGGMPTLHTVVRQRYYPTTKDQLFQPLASGVNITVPVAGPAGNSGRLFKLEVRLCSSVLTGKHKGHQGGNVDNVAAPALALNGVRIPAEFQSPVSGYPTPSHGVKFLCWTWMWFADWASARSVGLDLAEDGVNSISIVEVPRDVNGTISTVGLIPDFLMGLL